MNEQWLTPTGYKRLSPFLNDAAWQIKIKIFLADFYRIHHIRNK